MGIPEEPKATCTSGPILVIDDDAAARDRSVRELRVQGQPVREAPTLQYGLRLATLDPPYLIVLGHGQRDGNLEWLVARLRDHPRTAVIPVLLPAGQAGQEATVVLEHELHARPVGRLLERLLRGRTPDRHDDD